MPWRYNTILRRLPQTRRYIDSKIFVRGHSTPTASGSSTTTRSNPSRQPPLRNHASLLSQKDIDSSPVRVAGLVRSVRKQKKLAFAHLSDGSTYAPIQAVLQPEDAHELHNGAYAELEGIWQDSPGGKQAQEMNVHKVLAVGPSDVDASPLQKKTMTVDHLRMVPHMRLRVPMYSLLARVRSQVVASAHDFYSGMHNPLDEAIYVQPPIITSSDCEGAGEVFTVTPKLHLSLHAINREQGQQQQQQHYFRNPKYLTVSSQLHLEAFSAELGDVWTLAPAFRAEASDTGRHLAEMWMLEAEHRGITQLDELISRTQHLIRHLASGLIESRVGMEALQWYKHPAHGLENESEVDLLARWKALAHSDWPTFTYTDVMKELQLAFENNPTLFEREPTWDDGLHLEHEKWTVQNLGQDKPTVITHYPKAQKPFYMLPATDEADLSQGRVTVACFDLLLPHGTCEVVGGSLREHRLEHLISSMREKGLLSPSTHPARPTFSPGQYDATAPAPPPEKQPAYPFLRPGEFLGNLDWYVDLRRFGSSPHGGFGLGFDRLLMHLTGINNVRDVVPFPRTFKNCIA